MSIAILSIRDMLQYLSYDSIILDIFIYSIFTNSKIMIACYLLELLMNSKIKTKANYFINFKYLID